jgi:hypothetical protein
LEGLAKFGYKAKYVSRISLNFYLYFWLPNWNNMHRNMGIFLNFVELWL